MLKYCHAIKEKKIHKCRLRLLATVWDEKQYFAMSEFVIKSEMKRTVLLTIILLYNWMETIWANEMTFGWTTPHVQDHLNLLICSPEFYYYTIPPLISLTIGSRKLRILSVVSLNNWVTFVRVFIVWIVLIIETAGISLDEAQNLRQMTYTSRNRATSSHNLSTFLITAAECLCQ